MRRILEPLIITVIVVMASWLHVGWIRVWPIGGSALNIVIVVVIAIALFRSWPNTVWAASVAGLCLAQYSVWPWVVYPFALIGTVGALRLLMVRLIAAKSSASLIIGIGVATIIFYGLVGGQIILYRVFNEGLLRVGWVDLTYMALLQSIVHPILIFFVWRRITGGTFSFAVATENSPQPF